MQLVRYILPKTWTIRVKALGHAAGKGVIICMNESSTSLDEMLGGKFDLKEIEDTVRSRVNVKDLRLKLGEKSASRPKMRFIEGPPTMNGAPHAGHMRGRVVKDLWFRYNTLLGSDVKFTAGWDTQGPCRNI